MPTLKHPRTGETVKTEIFPYVPNHPMFKILHSLAAAQTGENDLGYVGHDGREAYFQKRGDATLRTVYLPGEGPDDFEGPTPTRTVPTPAAGRKSDPVLNALIGEALDTPNL